MSKKTKIRTVIRQMVREEVATAIREVITELKQPIEKISKPKPKNKIIENKNFSTNSVINDVLNETANNGEWRNMGKDIHTTDNMNEVMSSQYGNLMNSSNKNSVNVDDMMPSSIKTNPNDPMSQFLNKDYREVLKKTEEKTKQKRGV